MTEAEWFAVTDAVQLLQMCPASVSARKLRLFMADWCRLHWDTITVPLVRDAVELTEQFADARATKKQLERMYDTLRAVPHWGGIDALIMVWPDNHQMTEAAIRFCQRLGAGYSPPWGSDEAMARHQTKMLLLVNFLRDIVGNPFRPVAFDPGWRTSTVFTLAEQMYESRDFAPMPVLADALQDAGCDNEDILTHCRDPEAPHVRGCWVVDLVLGKS